jgi:hypothetical protein
MGARSLLLEPESRHRHGVHPEDRPVDLLFILPPPPRPFTLAYLLL